VLWKIFTFKKTKLVAMEWTTFSGKWIFPWMYTSLNFIHSSWNYAAGMPVFLWTLSTFINSTLSFYPLGTFNCLRISTAMRYMHNRKSEEHRLHKLYSVKSQEHGLNKYSNTPYNIQITYTFFPQNLCFKFSCLWYYNTTVLYKVWGPHSAIDEDSTVLLVE